MLRTDGTPSHLGQPGPQGLLYMALGRRSLGALRLESLDCIQEIEVGYVVRQAKTKSRLEESLDSKSGVNY
jgi:hypothetical protein